MNSLHFAAPAWLWFALLAPLGFAALCAHAARGRTKQLDAIADRQLQPRLIASHSPARRALKQTLIGLALAALGLALARPQWGAEFRAQDLEGEDLMIALDCSKSMLATDVRPNRLERARLAILDFVQSRPGGRVGLVAFAGQAFVQCPLTFDYDAFRECLMAVDEKTIPVQGTDLARALEEGSQAMEKDARRKLMILVTDGEDLEKCGVRKAAELAATNGVIIFTVGVGTSSGKVLEIAGDKATEVIRDRKGDAVTTRLDEQTLRNIADVTGGTYQPLGGLGQGFISVRDAIQASAGRPGKSGTQSVGIDRFHWFLALSLVLLVAESLIGTRRRLSENARA